MLHEPVSVLIPAFNEAGCITNVIREVRRILKDQAHEIIIIDDGSQDGTAAKAAAEGVRVLLHKRNRGYGAALKTGILAALMLVCLCAQGCSRRAWYEGLQETQRRDCYKLPNHAEIQDCLERVDTGTYEQYQKDRESMDDPLPLTEETTPGQATVLEESASGPAPG